MRTCYCGKLLFCGPCFSPPQPNIHRTSSAEKKQVIKKYKQLIPLTLSDNVICREHTAYRLLINYPTLLYITLSRCRCREAKRIVRCPALPICIGICFQQVDPTVAQSQRTLCPSRKSRLHKMYICALYRNDAGAFFALIFQCQYLALNRTISQMEWFVSIY